MIFSSKKHLISLGILGMLLFCLSILSCNTKHSLAAKKTTLKVSKQTLYVNGTYSIPLRNRISSATYTYISSKASVAKVTSSGKITAKNKGTAKIKVRYRYKRHMYTAGNFTVTVKKPVFRNGASTVTTIVGKTIVADNYIDNRNPYATYKISSTNSEVAYGNSSGKIYAIKAGTATLTIVECYKGLQRTLGRIEIIVTGASLNIETIKMSFNDTFPTKDLLRDKLTNATYNFVSTNTNLLTYDKTSGQLVSHKSPGYNTNCAVKVYEIRSDNTRLVGTIQINLIQTAFVATSDRQISVGLGTPIVLSEDCIHVTNPDPNATYTIFSSNTSVVSATNRAVGYGDSVITIQEIKQVNGRTVVTDLPEKVVVSVIKATIDPTIYRNGIDLTVDIDTYRDYPLANRNTFAKYSYISTSPTICQAGTAGAGTNNDYMVAKGLAFGNTTIKVEEVYLGVTRVVGYIKVRVSKDNQIIEDTDALTASDLIKAMSLHYKGKTFVAQVNNDLTCNFIDENGVGVLDYGMDLTKIVPGAFSVIPTRSRFTVDSMDVDPKDPYTWHLVIDINNTPQTTKIPITVTLKTAPLDVSKIISTIRAEVYLAQHIMTTETTFPDDPTRCQIAGDNLDYFVNFTSKQYITAGATEFDPKELNPIKLETLTNLSCTPLQYKFSEKNTDGNVAVTKLESGSSEDNRLWTFPIYFENGEILNCTVTFGVKDTDTE